VLPGAGEPLENPTMPAPSSAKRPVKSALIAAPDYRHALGHFASGVAVVTTMTPLGVPLGLTISSFSALSLEPPLVMFALRRASRLHEAFTLARGFAVNVLSADQQDMMRRFARPDDRFAGLKFEQGLDAAPLLPGAILWLECDVHSVQPGGDHSILIGAVRNARSFPGAPLLYWRGAVFPEPEST
jgi:flavin reductase (DIM6/NTAB) family NADH-FMN oxidoreductase RutF